MHIDVPTDIQTDIYVRDRFPYEDFTGHWPFGADAQKHGSKRGVVRFGSRGRDVVYVFPPSEVITAFGVRS
jgi:hypothetical protein